MTIPEEAPTGTTKPEDSADPPELLNLVYELRGSLAAARAQRELAEARVEVTVEDLKRHRRRLEQYRLFIIDMIGVLEAQASAMDGAVKAFTTGAGRLAGEPDNMVYHVGDMLGGLKPQGDPAFSPDLRSRFEKDTERRPAAPSQTLAERMAAQGRPLIGPPHAHRDQPCGENCYGPVA